MEEIFGGIFLEKFFGRIFTRIVWEELLGRDYLFYSNVEGIDLFFKILVFVNILSESKENLDPYKCDCKYIALRKKKFLNGQAGFQIWIDYFPKND